LAKLGINWKNLCESALLIRLGPRDYEMTIIWLPIYNLRTKPQESGTQW